MNTFDPSGYIVGKLEGEPEYIQECMYLYFQDKAPAPNPKYIAALEE